MAISRISFLLYNAALARHIKATQRAIARGCIRGALQLPSFHPTAVALYNRAYGRNGSLMFGSIEASTVKLVARSTTMQPNGVRLGNVYDFLEEDSINPYLDDLFP